MIKFLISKKFGNLEENHGCVHNFNNRRKLYSKLFVLFNLNNVSLD